MQKNGEGEKRNTRRKWYEWMIYFKCIVELEIDHNKNKFIEFVRNLVWNQFS